MLKFFAPGATERNAASSGHLPRGARRAPTLWKPLDIFSGAGGFVLRGEVAQCRPGRSTSSADLSMRSPL